MSAGNSYVKLHDDTQNKNEGIAQGAVTASSTQAAANTALIAFHRAVVKSALANGVSTSAAMAALRELGVTGLLLLASLWLSQPSHAAPLVAPCTETNITSVECDPVNTSNPLPVTSSPYPQGATAITGVFSGADTSSQAATLAGTAGKTTFICGYTVSGLGATGATNVLIAVATIIGGNTLNYSYTFAAGAAVQNTPVAFTYNPCLPANAAATAITVTVPGAAGNTATQINAWGYQR